MSSQPEESSGPVDIPSAPPEQPTAPELIQQDVDAGVIDEPTGLLYRVYAMFGAPELPAQYAAAQPTEDGAALATLQMEANDGTLPAEIADQVAPYLVRPTDPSSPFHGSAPPVGARAPFAADIAAAPMDVNCGSDGWASLADATNPITVWGSCAGGRDTSDLANFLSAIDSVYADETSIMGDPVLDAGGPDEGGDSNIDIYVVDQCVTRAGKCRFAEFDDAAAVTYGAPPYSGGSAGTASGYILIWRGYTAPADQESILAHEFFHVLEGAHNYSGTVQGGQWFWMVEASAKWAEEALVPAGRSKWVYSFVGDYQTTKLGLNDTGGNNEYASFLWPYFMDQQQGVQAVGNAWQAFEGQSGFDNLNTALSGIVPFESQFKDFAVHAWNSDIFVGHSNPDVIAPRFQALDKNLPDDDAVNDAKTHYTKAIGAQGPQGNMYTVKETIPTLAERYQLVDVDDSVQQLVVDFGGLEPSSPLDPLALLHYRDGHWERKDLPVGKTTFCRSDYDVTRILFVLADHSFSSDGTVSGQWTMQALIDPCMPTSYKLDLTNEGGSNRPDAGHYEGPANVECDQINGDWHDSFLEQPTTGQVRTIVLQTGQYAYVNANTVNGTADPGDWQIEQ
ncbi:MAG TPA: hypothetical protein VH371_02850, partial [Candidatus Limnocylindrales bacterium]